MEKKKHKRLSPDQRKVGIIEGAIRLLNDCRLSGYNFENVARECGCSKALVYSYFPGGKKQLLEAVLDHIKSELCCDGGHFYTTREYMSVLESIRGYNNDMATMVSKTFY